MGSQEEVHRMQTDISKAHSRPQAPSSSPVYLPTRNPPVAHCIGLPLGAVPRCEGGVCGRRHYDLISSIRAHKTVHSDTQ